MLKELLSKEESKILEFKENTQPLQKIIQTIIAFANTAGGTLVIGVKDTTKEIVGLDNLLKRRKNSQCNSRFRISFTNPYFPISHLEKPRSPHRHSIP